MIRRRKADINLEVTYIADDSHWVVRQLGGNPAKTFAIEPTKDEAEHVAILLAEVFAAHVNRDGSCEVYLRRLDGTWDRNTYPRSEDPRESRG